MIWILNLPYQLVLAVVAAAMFVGSWCGGKPRGGWREKLLGLVPRRTSDRPCLWFHAVSVGEVQLLGTLLAEMARRRPEVECVLSVTTRTGYELARKKHERLTVFYCPMDFSWAVAAAMRRARPSVLVLAETELWPNLVVGARRFGARVAVVNGRLGEKSHRGYRRVRWLFSRVLANVDLVAAQNETYADRFIDLGSAREKTRGPGSLKFDGAASDRGNADTRRLARLAGFDARDVVFLAGSTQAPEEEVALAVFRELAPRYPELRLVLVPRHAERFEEVATLLATSSSRWQRRSRLVDGADPRARVLLVDTIGELGAWWGTARIAFVGGSLGNRGGQNMIEPAAYGAAVSYGPNTWNFAEPARELVQAQAAVVVRDQEELAAFARRCLDDASYANGLGANAQAFVARHLGATARTAALLEELLERRGHIPAPKHLAQARGESTIHRRP